MIGSTEYVEEHIDDLRRNAIAYLNVDVAVTGNQFSANGSPILERSLLSVLGRVSDPYKNKTIKSLWSSEGKGLGGLGSGSDYVAFQDLAGCSSIDVGFYGEKYPYHSCYETFEWMEKFGDPDFQYHKILAQILGLLLLELADERLLTLDITAYASAVQRYVAELKRYATDVMDDAGDGPERPELDLKSLEEAAELLSKNAVRFMGWEDYWMARIYSSKKTESTALIRQRVEHNTRLSNFETDLLDIPRGGNEEGPHGVSFFLEAICHHA